MLRWPEILPRVFNHHFGEVFALPEAVVDDSVAVLQGQDGRKMSKSYNNTIPLFLPEKQMKKQINKIKTNLLEPGEEKDPDDSTVFQIWQAFASERQTAEMRQLFKDGIAWGESKKMLFELINAELADAREKYNDLMASPQQMEDILLAGAQKARQTAAPLITEIKKAVGIKAL